MLAAATPDASPLSHPPPPVLMSELAGNSSSAGKGAPLLRVSPSLREQQRTRTRSAGSANQQRRSETHGVSGLQSTASSALQAPQSQQQQPEIFGGILLPLTPAMKHRSSSASSRPKPIAQRVPDPPPPSRALPRNAPHPTPLRRGIYTLARAGPSIITAWEVSLSRAHITFCMTPPVSELSHQRKRPAQARTQRP